MHCVQKQFLRDSKNLQPYTLVAWSREDERNSDRVKPSEPWKTRCKAISNRQCEDLPEQEKHNEKMIPSEI